MNSSKSWSIILKCTPFLPKSDLFFQKTDLFFQNLIYFFKNQSILPDSDPFFKNLAIPLLLSYLFFQNLIRLIHPKSDPFIQILTNSSKIWYVSSKNRSVLPKSNPFFQKWIHIFQKKSIVLKTDPCSKIWWACSKNWSILWREKSLFKKSAWNIKI